MAPDVTTWKTSQNIYLTEVNLSSMYASLWQLPSYELPQIDFFSSLLSTSDHRFLLKLFWSTKTWHRVVFFVCYDFFFFFTNQTWTAPFLFLLISLIFPSFLFSSPLPSCPPLLSFLLLFVSHFLMFNIYILSFSSKKKYVTILFFPTCSFNMLVAPHKTVFYFW